MIDLEQFERIAMRHGSYASWAVWTTPTAGPKSNVGDLSVFNVTDNPTTLRLLKNDIVMVGLNISRSFAERFRNFHDPSPKANDFKIRHAFTQTPYYGAYMTDIIKDVEMVSSTDLLDHLRAVPSILPTSVGIFREELKDLGARRPTILAFGSAAFRLIAANISPGEYSSLVRLTHYSHRMDKENYREKVLAQIADALGSNRPRGSNVEIGH